ncbi:MAG: hypothetical protein II458_01815, partial [Oscillospiraceae bacterium]|nr:hypothetical protein [Oscillospiraceae bacterium]
MKRIIRPIVSALLACVLLLSAAVPAFAETDYLAYGTTDEIRTSGCGEEYIVLRTPSDEPCTMYVEGVFASNTKMILIRLLNDADGSVMRVFVRPENDGSLAVRIDTTEGSKEFP